MGKLPPEELELFEHHKPRKIDKRKRHHPGFTEDVQEKRATRLTFKNYVRGLEDTLAEEEGEDWAVQSRSGDGDWKELAVFVTEEEAEEALIEYEETDPSDTQYRIERV